MGFCALGLRFMKKKNNRKMGMGFQFEQLQAGIVGFELGFEKNNFLGNGIKTPPPLYDPLLQLRCGTHYYSAANRELWPRGIWGLVYFQFWVCLIHIIKEWRYSFSCLELIDIIKLKTGQLLGIYLWLSNVILNKLGPVGF